MHLLVNLLFSATESIRYACRTTPCMRFIMQSSITLHIIDVDAVRRKLLLPGNLREEVPTSERDWVSFRSTCCSQNQRTAANYHHFASVGNLLILVLLEQLAPGNSSFLVLPLRLITMSWFHGRSCPCECKALTTMALIG